jgi:transposase-like protein
MAYSPEIRDKLRRAYIFGQMSLEIAASQVGVSFVSARRWKKEAQDKGDDWDALRSAHVLAGGTVEETGRAILTSMLVQYQTTMELLTNDSELKAPQRVELLASLGDSFQQGNFGQ